ncbi:MAG: hypothetical protein ACE5FK_02055 [Candidatus Methylomirabilia bacterium]
MEVVTLIIAVIALVIAAAAFQRTGGIQDVRHQVEILNTRAETARERTANTLARLERFIRGKEKTPPEPGQEGGSRVDAE